MNEDESVVDRMYRAGRQRPQPVYDTHHVEDLGIRRRTSLEQLREVQRRLLPLAERLLRQLEPEPDRPNRTAVEAFGLVAALGLTVDQVEAEHEQLLWQLRIAAGRQGEDANREAVLVDALRLIAGDRCENFTGRSRCSQEGSGRRRGAEYGAEAWCPACIAQDALDHVAAAEEACPADPDGQHHVGCGCDDADHGWAP